MKKILSLISVLSLMLMFNACSEKEGTLFELGGNDYWSFHSVKQKIDANESGKAVVYLYHINDAKVTPVNLTVSYDTASEGLFTISSTSISAVDGVGNKAAIEITYDVDSLEFNVPYKLGFVIPKQVGFAVKNSLIDSIEVTIIRPLSFYELGAGTFTSEFFEEEWDQLVLSANETSMYQLPDCYEAGKPINIQINGDGTVTIAEQVAWYYDEEYGDVYVNGTGTIDGDVITMSLEHVVKSIDYSFGVATEVLILPAP